MEEEYRKDLSIGNEGENSSLSGDFMPNGCDNEAESAPRKEQERTSLSARGTHDSDPLLPREEKQELQALPLRQPASPRVERRNGYRTQAAAGGAHKRGDAKAPKSSLRASIFKILSGAFLSKNPWTIAIFLVVAIWSTIGIWQSYRLNYLISRIDTLETSLENTYRKQQELTYRLHSAIRPDEVELRLQAIGSTIAPSKEPFFVLYVNEPEGLYDEESDY